MKRRFCLASATCLVLTLLLAPSAWADQPLGINLGYTSFMDGAPPAGPGFYLAEYLAYRSAYGVRNNPVDASDPHLDVWVNLNQFLYQSDTPILFGGKWGLDVIVPFVSIRGEPAPLPDDNGGMGDLTVGPYLQWDPIMGKNGPIFMHRIELQTIWPTGHYTDEKLLNPGANHFSFNPYWAGTFFFTPQWTASWRLHYLWNADNDEPFVGFGVNKVEPGQAFHANFASSYEVVPKMLRLGANGYYLVEITESKHDGVKQGREEVLGIGPGLLFSFSQNTHVFFNSYFETDVHYRPQGNLFVLRLVHHF